MARIAPTSSLPPAIEYPHVCVPSAAALLAESAATGRHVAWGDVTWSSAEDLDCDAHACHGGPRVLGGSGHTLAAHAIEPRGPAATSSFSAGNSASSLFAETSGCSMASERFPRLHAPAEQLDAMSEVSEGCGMHPMASVRSASAPAIVAAARAPFLQDSEQGDDSCVSTLLAFLSGDLHSSPMCLFPADCFKHKRSLQCLRADSCIRRSPRGY